MKAGNIAWGVMGAGILAFEVLSEDKLSNSVDRALEKPYVRHLTLAAIGLTALHLVNLLDDYPKLDPYYWLAKVYE